MVEKLRRAPLAAFVQPVRAAAMYRALKGCSHGDCACYARVTPLRVHSAADAFADTIADAFADAIADGAADIFRRCAPFASNPRLSSANGP